MYATRSFLHPPTVPGSGRIHQDRSLEATLHETDRQRQIRDSVSMIDSRNSPLLAEPTRQTHLFQSLCLGVPAQSAESTKHLPRQRSRAAQVWITCINCFRAYHTGIPTPVRPCDERHLDRKLTAFCTTRSQACLRYWPAGKKLPCHMASFRLSQSAALRNRSRRSDGRALAECASVRGNSSALKKPISSDQATAGHTEMRHSGLTKNDAPVAPTSAQSQLMTRAPISALPESAPGRSCRTDPSPRSCTPVRIPESGVSSAPIRLYFLAEIDLSIMRAVFKLLQLDAHCNEMAALADNDSVLLVQDNAGWNKAKQCPRSNYFGYT